MTDLVSALIGADIMSLNFQLLFCPRVRLNVYNNVKNLNPWQNPLCYHDRLKYFKSETIAINPLTHGRFSDPYFKVL